MVSLALLVYNHDVRSTYMPCSKVGGIGHHCAVQLLQHSVREESAFTGCKELLTLNLSERQQHRRVLRRNIQHLEHETQVHIVGSL